MVESTTYYGFSAVQGLDSLTDINLIKQDLLNHINTRKGERLMLPEYGSIIWDLLFENKSPTILNEIKQDLTRIIEEEPRVSLEKMEILELDRGYVGFVDLYFNNFMTSDRLTIQFNQRLA